MAEIKVHRAPEYSVKQSPVLPMVKTPYRGTLIGASGQGKTVWLASWICDIMPQHDRYYIFSHSIHQDSAWVPVKKCIEARLKIDPQKEDPPLYYDQYEHAALQKIITQQHEMVKLAKKQGKKTLPSILVIFDDMLDDSQLMTTRGSNSRLLASLYIRGRHDQISTLTSVQRFAGLNALVKSQSTFYIVYRLRSATDLEALSEFVSAVYPGGKKVVEAIYRRAIEDRDWSFLVVNLMARTPEDTFWLRFEKRLVPRSDIQVNDQADGPSRR